MADGDTHVDLLTQFWLVAGKPATVDAAGFAAVGTYIRLKGLLTIPQTGDTAEDISEATLDEGRTEHSFGVVDGGSIELSIKGIEGDAGQAIITGDRNRFFDFPELSDSQCWAGICFGKLNRRFQFPRQNGL